MSVEALIWWVTLAGLAIVLAMTVAQVLRALREMNRLVSHLDELADPPVLRALERADADQRRIESALAQIAPLQARAQAAVAVIRRGPLPPELSAAVRRLRAELAAFRAFAGR